MSFPLPKAPRMSLLREHVMEQLNRRSALKLVVPALGVSVLTGRMSLAADDDDAKEQAAKPERVLVGPFSLGELYWARRNAEKYRGQPLGEELLFMKGPADGDIRMSLNDCRLYVIDQRFPDPHKPGNWRFGSDEEFPKLALEGVIVHELNDSAGNEFLILIEKFRACGTETGYLKSRPPYRKFCLSATVKFRGSIGIVRAKASSDYDFGDVGYDINGEVLKHGDAAG
jgi:hypothetical protein